MRYDPLIILVSFFQGFNVKLDHVLRANFNPGGRTTYYITFAARESDSPDAPLVEYQAKVDWSAGKTYPILCRPTSPKLGNLFSPLIFRF